MSEDDWCSICGGNSGDPCDRCEADARQAKEEYVVELKERVLYLEAELANERATHKECAEQSQHWRACLEEVRRKLDAECARVAELERENEALREVRRRASTVWRMLCDMQGRAYNSQQCDALAKALNDTELLAGQGGRTESELSGCEQCPVCGKPKGIGMACGWVHPDAPTRPVAGAQLLAHLASPPDCHPAPPVAAERPTDDAWKDFCESVATHVDEEEAAQLWQMLAYVKRIKEEERHLRTRLGVRIEELEAAEKRVAELEAHTKNQATIIEKQRLALAEFPHSGSASWVEQMAETAKLRAQLTTADKAGSERRKWVGHLGEIIDVACLELNTAGHRMTAWTLKGTYQNLRREVIDEAGESK